MYTLSNQKLAQLKLKLKRVIKLGSNQDIIDEVERAYKIFEKEGWPDCWSDWQRAADDAEFFSIYNN